MLYYIHNSLDAFSHNLCEWIACVVGVFGMPAGGSVMISNAILHNSLDAFSFHLRHFDMCVATNVISFMCTGSTSSFPQTHCS